MEEEEEEEEEDEGRQALSGQQEGDQLGRQKQPQMEQRSPPQRQLQPAKKAAQKQRETQQQEKPTQRREPERQTHVPAAVVLGQVLAKTAISPDAIKVGGSGVWLAGWLSHHMLVLWYK